MISKIQTNNSNYPYKSNWTKKYIGGTIILYSLNRQPPPCKETP